ncbi:MAG: fumarylacetoacetate hydrolase family protein [Bacteroidales bacterium]|nr:fumarylacetoacetate hydrolase family protein [Bacteroidales bacterium]
MKIICIGRNYVAHARELNNEVPDNPVFFMKPDSALVTANRPFFYPEFSNDVHHELEVVIRINRLGRSIEEQYASRYFNEVALGVDFTARDLQAEQKKKGLPWEIAKAFDYSAPISEFFPLDKFGDIHNLSFRLDLNGKTVQDGNTSLMIFSFEKIIAYVSRFMTLKTGDLIYTGTPAGVGPVAINDRLEAYLEGDKLMDFPVK